MEAITIRLEESTIESIDDEAAEHDRSRSEHIREIIRTRNEHAELSERVARLETENERLTRERRQLLAQREEHTKLQRYAETERAYREAGLTERLKWWLWGRKRE